MKTKAEGVQNYRDKEIKINSNNAVAPMICKKKMPGWSVK